jgi:Uncharacterized protein conserved in bacteria (DUF2064)
MQAPLSGPRIKENLDADENSFQNSVVRYDYLRRQPSAQWVPRLVERPRSPAMSLYAPAGNEALFDGHLAQGTGRLLADGSPLMPSEVQGLGRCLLHAIRAMLTRGHESAVMLNADSPTLPTELLVRTAVALASEGDRIVLGPADDGGYYLLGMNAAHAHLLADIPWSTHRVAETTRNRAAELGLAVVELPSWYDVDNPESLRRLVGETLDPPTGASGTVSPPGRRRTTAPTSWDLVPYAAPFTARALARVAGCSRPK